ncbi:MAG: lipopolysaccharide biosynthesis protein, partial [Candidatus Babeliales bacterium]
MLKFYVKKGAYNTFFYGLSSLVSRALSFVFLPYFLAKLTLEEFGVWDFYQTFFSIGTLILSSTAATGLIRFFLLYKNDPKKQQAVVGNSLAFVLSGCILFQLGSFATLFLYYKNHPNFIFLLLTSLNISLFALFSLLLAYLRVKEYLWSYFFIFCGQSSLAIALTVMGIYTNQGINSFFYANCVSLIIFLPFFAYLFKNYLTFSFTIFKQQLIYSVPLLVYSFLYSFFFSIDRFFIKEYAGYEALGTYALLWRFGAIFQFFSIALIDASPVMLFNAQKEHNGNFLIAKFINYFCIAITSVCLIAIIGARIGIGLFFPEKYYFLISLLPLFFIPIIMLEVARILQFGINLSTKTIYGPLITSIGLSIQTFMLYILKDFNIHGILLANSISFALLCIIAYQLSSFIYSKAIFNPKKLSILISLFLGHTLLLQMLFYYNAPYFMLILPLASWIAALWHNNIIEQEEKNYIMTTVKKPFKIIHPK